MENIQIPWKKNAIYFLTSQAVTLFGSSLVQYAITWHITLTTGSGTMMMFTILAGFLPAFLVSPFAGVLADKFSKKKLIIVADLSIALTTLVLAILLSIGYETYWVFFITLALRALGTGIQSPVVGSIIPEFVPKEFLTKINGINGSIQTFIMILSPILSGALLAAIPLGSIFFIDVITAILASSILFIFFNLPAKDINEVGENKSHYIQDFKEGIIYIKEHAYVKTFFLFCTVFFFLISPAAFMTPLQVVRKFGANVWNLSATEIAFSVGMLLGGILITTWGGFKNKVKTMLFSSILISLLTFALGVAPLLWIYLGIMGLFGITIPLFSTPATVLLQEKVEQKYMGRIFGIYGMISSSMMPLGMILFGPLGDVIDIEWLMLGTGVLILITSIVILRNSTFVSAGESTETK